MKITDPWCLWIVAHEFNAAADLYTQSIDKNPADATVWCNRAYARMKLEEYGYALTDAGACAAHLSANICLTRF